MTERIPTPYFLLDEPILQRYFDMLTGALKENWPNYRIGYSFKTNSLPWLVNFYKKQGAYAEVVSRDEYGLAKYLGFQDSEIVYNGPYKDEQSFRDVVLAGGYVNVDSKWELEWLTKLSGELEEEKAEEKEKVSEIHVGIRVNFNLEQMCPGETTMGETSGRFGFSYENGEFAKALSYVRALPHVKVTGLHLHSSSKSRSVQIFRSIAQMACRLKKEFDLTLSYVDIGGGYCGGMEGRPEYPDYFPAIAEELHREFDPEQTQLVVEPGISLISKGSFFVTSVIDVRDIRDTRYLITDGSRFNIDATMIKSSYLYHTKLQNPSAPVMERQEITGYTCMECDRLFTMENLPELQTGDQIIYENVGGYTISLNPLFIQYFPAVYVRNGEQMTEVRKKWTAKEYVQGNVW
ncbi:MAG: pyridoxal-dependent decarboxylase [Lachnospiraceae bacterium]|nr:pyridoxal-dependent decarboxylase [Lachnospiraceae bacterium]